MAFETGDDPSVRHSAQSYVGGLVPVEEDDAVLEEGYFLAPVTFADESRQAVQVVWEGGADVERRHVHQ